MRRWGLAFLMAGVAALPASAQNTVRWNDVVKSLDGLDQEPPAVSVWLDRRIVNYGEPIRVGFRVEEDAFVVVARVDNDGRLTILFPAGRNRATEIKGGEDYYVRSTRYGSAAAFIALERPGSTGYIFALASRTPMDLTRLTQRDFSQWVTGQQLTQPASRYFGDPYRVVQRFARVVAFSETTEFDYDVEFYSVDRPLYVSAANYGCAYMSGLYGYGGRNYGTRLWNRGLLYDEFGTPSFDASCPSSSFSCLLPIFSLSYPFWIPASYYCYNQPRQVAQGTPNGPTQPPVSPPLDENPVNPWVPDSAVKPPHLNTQENGAQNGPHIMMDRPNPAAWNDREDLSFSIPARALRGMRGARREDAGSVPIRSPDAGSGPLPMPGRPTPTSTETPMEWVRPPRSFDAPTRDPVDRLPTRYSRRESYGRDEGMPSRAGGFREFGGPPPRTGSPMFDRDPGRNMSIPQFHFNSYGMGGSGGGGMYSPPAHIESRPATSGGIMVNPGTSSGQPSSPPAASSSGSGSSSGSEKKPH